MSANLLWFLPMSWRWAIVDIIRKFDVHIRQLCIGTIGVLEEGDKRDTINVLFCGIIPNAAEGFNERCLKMQTAPQLGTDRLFRKLTWWSVRT